MSYASISGRARTSPTRPQAHAICMRCGGRFNRVDLQFQWDWRGAQLQNLWILVCKSCYDVPQENLRAVTLPADPDPVFYPSVQDFAAAEIDSRTLSAPTVLDPATGIPIPGTTVRMTQDCETRTLQDVGTPFGLDQRAVMPLVGTTHYGVPLQLLSVSANGTATIAVTCSAVHGLVTGSQVSVEGLSVRAACGFYTVNVLTATAFSYQIAGNIAAGALLTPTTRIVTALVGLPLGDTEVPVHG